MALDLDLGPHVSSWCEAGLLAWEKIFKWFLCFLSSANHITEESHTGFFTCLLFIASPRSKNTSCKLWLVAFPSAYCLPGCWNEHWIILLGSERLLKSTSLCSFWHNVIYLFAWFLLFQTCMLTLFCEMQKKIFSIYMYAFEYWIMLVALFQTVTISGNWSF